MHLDRRPYQLNKRDVQLFAEAGVPTQAGVLSWRLTRDRPACPRPPDSRACVATFTTMNVQGVTPSDKVILNPADSLVTGAIVRVAATPAPAVAKK